MAKIQINMENPAEYEKSFVVPEPGDYTLMISNRPKAEKSKSSENLITKLELEGETNEGEKFKVFDNLVHNEKCYFKIYQCFRALGFSDDEIKNGIDEDDLYGMTLQAKLVQEIVKEGANAGDPRATVKKYLYT